MMAWIGSPNDQTYAAFEAFHGLAETGVVPSVCEPGHKDGWGFVAYHSQDATIQLSKKMVVSASHAREDFFRAVDQGIENRSNCMIAHLRKASPGMAIIEENVHPYRHGSLAFCHNGYVEGFSNASLALDETYQSLRKGTNDSEHLFLRLLQEYAGNDQDVSRALVSITKQVLSVSYRSFITIVADGRRVYFSRFVNDQDPYLQQFPELIDGYYSFFLGMDSSNMVRMGCSEALPVHGMRWQAIPNHTMMMVDRTTGEQRRVTL